MPRKHAEIVSDVKSTAALTGFCLAHMSEDDHNKCPGVQDMGWGSINTCPCKHHDYNKGK